MINSVLEQLRACNNASDSFEVLKSHYRPILGADFSIFFKAENPEFSSTECLSRELTTRAFNKDPHTAIRKIIDPIVLDYHRNKFQKTVIIRDEGVFAVVLKALGWEWKCKKQYWPPLSHTNTKAKKELSYAIKKYKRGLAFSNLIKSLANRPIRPATMLMPESAWRDLQRFNAMTAPLRGRLSQPSFTEEIFGSVPPLTQVGEGPSNEPPFVTGRSIRPTTSDLARTLFPIQELPDGAEPIYALAPFPEAEEPEEE